MSNLLQVKDTGVSSLLTSILLSFLFNMCLFSHKEYSGLGGRCVHKARILRDGVQKN